MAFALDDLRRHVLQCPDEAVVAASIRQAMLGEPKVRQPDVPLAVQQHVFLEQSGSGFRLQGFSEVQGAW